VEYFNCGLAGGPLSICAMAGTAASMTATMIVAVKCNDIFDRIDFAPFTEIPN
jgi:hypothetical protein